MHRHVCFPVKSEPKHVDPRQGQHVPNVRHAQCDVEFQHDDPNDDPHDGPNGVAQYAQRDVANVRSVQRDGDEDSAQPHS